MPGPQRESHSLQCGFTKPADQSVRRGQMKVGFRSFAGVIVDVALVWMAAAVIAAQQQASGTVALLADDIGGVVTSAKGPEAGVWVIAETRELPTRFAKI